MKELIKKVLRRQNSFKKKQNSEKNKKNVDTKSAILAPYNSMLSEEENGNISSSRRKESLCDILDNFNDELEIKNGIIKFHGKAKEFNMNYELNNNEENDNEEEEEEQESEGTSEEEDSYEGKKKPKSKQKELEMLTEQYNKLKKQNEEYEKKINNYKKIYKDLKNKINNLKQMPNSNDRSQRKFGNNGIEPTTDDTNSRPNA